jgi:hypothetical protein
MRFRVGLFVAVFALIAGVGCRKALAPNVDRNQPPETWITAAPQDTITVKDGPVVTPPTIGRIPFRFHLYWAGSDHDGQVVGYYWAVTETVPTPGIDIPPPLPGPKPNDYKFTSKTDSVFIFNVREDTNQRQHAFFIYAVDNQGKPDATPARIVFNALDRFPPIPIITLAQGTGFVFDPSIPSAPPVLRAYGIRDTFDSRNPKPAPADTVPSGSALSFRWRADLAAANNPAVAFKYKLEETDFVEDPATVDSVRYAAGRTGPGNKKFLLRAIDVAGGARTAPETNRFFRVNFSPDSWFTGPERNAGALPGFVQRPEDGVIYRAMTVWPDNERGTTGDLGPGGVTNTLLSPDSFSVMPVSRLRREPITFFEIWKDTIYVRQEGDTVHMNSWVLFHAGGFDKDSPYNVRVDGFAFDTTAGPLLQRRPPNGSPTGFRLAIVNDLTPQGPASIFPLSPTFPLDEVLLVPERHVGYYLGVQQSGRMYAMMRAEDGNRDIDLRVANPKAFVDSVERGQMPSDRLPLRTRILTFHINRAPYLQTGRPDFSPLEGSSWPTRLIGLNLPALDDDPYDPLQREVGGPRPATPTTPSFNFTVWLTGLDANGDPVTYIPSAPGYYRASSPPTSITVPASIVGPQVRVHVELCDFPDETFSPGKGRCRTYVFNVNVPPPPSPAAARGAGAVSNRPGDSENRSGSVIR